MSYCDQNFNFVQKRQGYIRRSEASMRLFIYDCTWGGVGDGLAASTPPIAPQARPSQRDANGTSSLV
eukprot:92555-Pleurochrysis_carterae.AAC.1